jgi:hypothetical protein
MPKPLYPGLYGWQVTYQLPDGSVVFCSCFHEVMRCFFSCLRNELADSYLHRADWPDRQELDIFVPSLNLAIEYQGEQHGVLHPTED